MTLATCHDLELGDAWAYGKGILHGGWLDESCEIWAASGQLVAQARQLAGYREDVA